MERSMFYIAERQRVKLMEELKQESRLPVWLEEKMNIVCENYKHIIHSLLWEEEKPEQIELELEGNYKGSF